MLITYDDETERMRHARVLFDSQCEKNLLSTDFLQRGFGLTFDDSHGELLGYSVNGRAIMSIGRRDIRWWTPHLNRYAYDSCHIVKSDGFDLIIGVETMTALGIFEVRRRSLIGAFMTPRPGRNGVSQLCSEIDKRLMLASS